MKYSGIGGQAVMEGIMMRNREKYAVAVRLPDGRIHIEKKTLKEPSSVMKLPLIRGIVSFVMSLKLGIETLMLSASFFEEDEPSPKERTKAQENREMTLTLLIAVVLAILIFIGIPYLVSRLLGHFTDAAWVLNVVEGVVKFFVFLIYMMVISRAKEIRRVFMYHGAEHKCINCIESGQRLTVENVRNSSRLHKRCGTSFLFLVIFLSIIFHIFILVDSHLLQVVLRLAFIPVIAAVAYELIRWAGHSQNPVVRIFSQPGLWLQRLTTIEPEDDMIEVGIASVEAVFDWRKFQGRPPKLTMQKAYVKALTMLKEAGFTGLAAQVSDLMESALGVTPKQRHLEPQKEVLPNEWEALEALVKRRLQHEPLQQITGKQEFYGYTFAVTKDVLCPRQETEILVDLAKQQLRPGMRILDVCTGSGCILLSLLKIASEKEEPNDSFTEMMKVIGVGTDVSHAALSVAKDNAKSLGVDASFIQGDMFAAVPQGSKYDMITINPPYIATSQIASLMPEVRDFEPHAALDGGTDGLDFYRRIAREVTPFMAEGCLLFMEIGYDQGQSVPKLFEDAGFCHIQVLQDLNGCDRIVVCENKGEIHV